MKFDNLRPPFLDRGSAETGARMAPPKRRLTGEEAKAAGMDITKFFTPPPPPPPKPGRPACSKNIRRGRQAVEAPPSINHINAATEAASAAAGASKSPTEASPAVGAPATKCKTGPTKIKKQRVNYSQGEALKKMEDAVREWESGTGVAASEPNMSRARFCALVEIPEETFRKYVAGPKEKRRKIGSGVGNSATELNVTASTGLLFAICVILFAICATKCEAGRALA